MLLNKTPTLGKIIFCERNITYEKAKKSAEDRKLKYIEVSAMTGQNLPECFEILL